MNDKPDILGTRFDFVDYERVMQCLLDYKSRCERVYFVLSNPHSVMTARRNAAFKNAVERATLVLPDGVGIVMAARLLNYAHSGRVAGPTLMLKLCDWGRAHKLRHFFYGGGADIAERLAYKLKERFPGLVVAGCLTPPFRALTPDEDQEMIAKINAASPDIVWVGLGAPKQELWMQEHLGKLEATVMIGVGAAFDFHSGNIPWTPRFIRAIGMEWLFRLCCEPRRLWRRNLDSPLFLIKVLLQRRF